MTPKRWGIVAMVVILLVAGYMLFGHKTTTPVVGTPYEWQFSDRGEKDGVPQTEVTLVASGSSYTIGTYEGTCAVQDGVTTDYLQYEKSKVICWFAGGGHEVGVFEEPGQVVVRVGDLDEGASGVEGFRGNFELVVRLR